MQNQRMQLLYNSIYFNDFKFLFDNVSNIGGKMMCEYNTVRFDVHEPRLIFLKGSLKQGVLKLITRHVDLAWSN